MKIRKSFSNGAGQSTSYGPGSPGGPDKRQAAILNFWRSQSHWARMP